MFHEKSMSIFILMEMVDSFRRGWMVIKRTPPRSMRIISVFNSRSEREDDL